MAKAKVARKSTTIDMTAMCDVAFLLLTFFILTSQAKPAEPLVVDTPASVVKIKVPEVDIATLTIGKGQVFFGIAGQEIRKNTLLRIGEQYHIQFTEEELKRFSVVQSFGVPIDKIKAYIAANETDRLRNGFQTGIPTDASTNKDILHSELHSWILAARYATKELDGKELRITIKGDQQEEYPTIKKVIDILQKQNVNKFSLITNLRSEN